MGGCTLTLRVGLCYLLFTTLILVDIFAATQTLTPLIHSLFTGLNNMSNKEHLNYNSSNVNSFLQTHNDTLDFDTKITVGMVHDVTTLVVEMFCLVALFLSNGTAMVGLRRAEAYLLVPWLFVYLIGIIRSALTYPQHHTLIKLVVLRSVIGSRNF
jgi:hypothetical protein